MIKTKCILIDHPLAIYMRCALADVYSLGRLSLIANMQFSCMCWSPIDQKLIKILKHAKNINKI